MAEKALAILAADGISDEPASSIPRGVRLRSLPGASAKLLLKNSISALPLHKVLVLSDALDGEHDSAFADHERLALARILPVEVGNLRFGPEVGLGTVKLDARWCLCGLSGCERCAPICTSSGHALPLRLLPSTRMPDWSANSLSPAASMRSSPRRRTRTRRTTRAPCASNRCFWAISAAGRIFRR